MITTCQWRTGSRQVKNILTQTDWRQGRSKCTQCVLMRPTNLHRPLPWHWCHCAGRPLFLLTWLLNHGRTWSRSSLCLASDDERPQRCDESHSRSRSQNLKKQCKTCFKTVPACNCVLHNDDILRLTEWSPCWTAYFKLLKQTKFQLCVISLRDSTVKGMSRKTNIFFSQRQSSERC